MLISIPGVDPIFMWAGFILLVFIFLWIDLAVFNKKAHEITIKEALIWAAVWFGLAMLFNVWIYYEFGGEIALQYFTGYLIEKSLSVDNLFVILLIFTTFGIPAKFQHRVLFWGIVGAIVMRGLFIFAGSALIEHFNWVFVVFGAVLLYAAYRMQFGKSEKFDPKKSLAVRFARKLFPVSDELKEHHFFTVENGKRTATLLFLTLIVIEFTDVIFAFDSIPAIFAITTEPFIVFTSNIFAILGLRSLYFVLADMQSMFEYLKTGLAAILLFIGIKLIIKYWHVEIPVFISLVFIVSVLFISIFASVRHHKKQHAIVGSQPHTAHTAMHTFHNTTDLENTKDLEKALAHTVHNTPTQGAITSVQNAQNTMPIHNTIHNTIAKNTQSAQPKDDIAVELDVPQITSKIMPPPAIGAKLTASIVQKAAKSFKMRHTTKKKTAKRPSEKLSKTPSTSKNIILKSKKKKKR